ncbi:uncharacterized protein LOC110172592, partial [Boleophthalmus pectinirostris]|uniref:uncharacterized protein LOC110172592 n=1 Tax=Boleophthalmus pectinirostris TaxID=150288 RepID=UPI00242A82C1
MSGHYSGSNGDSSHELRLFLLGNIGCGKTCSADTILNEKAALSHSMSRGLVQRQGFVEGRRVTVVEAPRWYWSGGQMDESIRKETAKAMMALTPGPHAILLLIPVFQFTEMETLVPAELERLFGEDVLDHTLVLFTCGDYLIGRSLEEYLKKEPPALSQILERCNGRCHVINNRNRQDRQQVTKLLDKVDTIVQRNGIHTVKTEEERELERRIQERKRELMENYRAQREAQRQSMSVEFGNTTETKNTVSSVTEWASRGQDTIEGRAESRQVSNGPYSTPVPEQQTEQQLSRTPSFRLNSEGTILSKMSESIATPKMTSTFHHRINSFEESSPEVSPTTSPHSPAFSSPPASPTAFAFASAMAPAYARSASPSASQSAELRLVLVGRSGAGKSGVGNCILGYEAFRSDLVTQDCEKKRAEVCGRK